MLIFYVYNTNGRGNAKKRLIPALRVSSMATLAFYLWKLVYDTRQGQIFAQKALKHSIAPNYDFILINRTVANAVHYVVIRLNQFNSVSIVV